MTMTAALFEPIKVGPLKLPNRVVMAPMGRLFANDGVPSPDAAAYYRRRVEGGVGLVITEASAVDHPLASDYPGVPHMYGEVALAEWKKVVDGVHAAGGRIMPQLFHQGMLRGGGVSDGSLQSFRPSGVIGTPGPTAYSPEFIKQASVPTKPMSDSDIQEVIDAFSRSAKMAVDLGFDGIEIHGAHGYIVDSFLWGETNLRDDRYGGDQRARTALAVEVIRAVRAATGPDLPVFFRFSQHKTSNYDARLAETPQQLEAVLGPIADAGVDVIDASMRRFFQPAFEGSHLNLAGWAQKLTGKPSIAVGSIGLNNSASDTFLKKDSESANNIPQLIERFSTGEFDMVSIGRSLIGDADFVSKLRTGEPFTPFHRGALDTLV
ncbi:MAG: putative NADH:flavin oxidoreductase/NADH oxidase [Microbacteriaceae bacterium]|nr:putative NADH:flavin oxidoreductase/NADH oxidase [Microbacteriaceae bacterium]